MASSGGGGRGEWIRTTDPLLPKQMRYQAALRPEAGHSIPTGRQSGSVMVGAAWRRSRIAPAVGRRSKAASAARRAAERSVAAGRVPEGVTTEMAERRRIEAVGVVRVIVRRVVI